MIESFLSGFSGLVAGFLNLQWPSVVMMVVGGGLLYLGIRKDI